MQRNRSTGKRRSCLQGELVCTVRVPSEVAEIRKMYGGAIGHIFANIRVATSPYTNIPVWGALFVALAYSRGSLP